MSSQTPGSKRPRAILDNLLHPGEWRNKRARSGSRSGSPSASGISTPGDIYSHSPAQPNPSSKSPSPMGRPGPSAPSHSSPNATLHVPAPPPNETQTASLPVTDITASTQSSTAVGWAGLEQALQALRVSAKICPPLSSAVDVLASCLPLFEAAARNRIDYDELATGLKSMVDLLIRYLNDTSSEEFLDTITGIAEIIRREIESINMHQSRNLPRRMLGASSTEDDLIRRYRRIEQLFRQLQGEASPRTFSATNERRFDERLERLHPTKLARFNSKLSTEVSRRGCTKDTRTKILEDAIAWSEDPDLAKIYWTNGMAGTGKTTIAYSFCERLEAVKQLAASFFCVHTSSECRDANQIIPTIAYQLARRFTPFRHSLDQQLKKDPDISTIQLSYQFDLLLKKPLLAAKDKLPNNLVIVVDALDECSNPNIVREFLGLLFHSVGELPVKFFVTSRPEPVIRNKMMPESERSRSILYLHEIEQSLVQADIELYLREELASITPADITELAEHASNLFIYAATAVRYIRPVGTVVKTRLNAILAISAESKNKLSAIDVLYEAILTAAIDDQGLEPEEQDRMRLVLWTAICACEPILIHTLSILSGLDNKDATMVTLESLRSVLHVSEHSELVTTLHASFPDYILTRERSRAFYCDKVTHSQLLAEQCFRVMNTQLRFNICSIQSSFVPDDEIPELGERINTRISKELFYACRFWVDHLSETKSRALFLLANDFLSQQLLFWMEVMNLKRCMTLGVTSISKLNAWLTQVHVDTDTDLLALASDARRFVTRYASSPIASYTPHIYLSALPLSPSSSSMRSRYLPRFKGLIKVSGAILDKLEKAAPSTWELTSLIRSVAFSPGGDCVVLGDDQGRISVQNAYDGKCLVQPFKAHKKVVTSLGVSSDGMQIVSGSHDMTLSVWNIHDGSLITGPYKGHTNRVTSVAFSPDVAHIVSGSDDCTVRIWGPQVVTISMISLTGHAQEVKSVAFSPDGSRVVSGSVDHTIRLWDLSSGATILILDGHTASVSAVQYSPDGAYIISGSHDSNILIWNASNGSLTRRLQKAHSKPITAIAISPSGDHIVSGSLDCTVRVWNLHNGKLTAGPFEGHTESVRSVGFLSDGMRIVSASDDKTVRVWNAQDQIPQSAWTSNERGSSLHDHFAYSPTKTHVAVFTLYKTTFLVWDLRTMTVISVPTNGGVRHLRFSPDGTHIHSIHNEGTLCTWIVQTGELLEGPHRCSSSDRFITSECSADGTRVVTLGMNMMVELWHVKANRNPILCATSVSCSPIFSQVGDRFITYAYDPVNPLNSYVNVWDADTGRHVAGPFSTERVHDFSPDGTYICCKQQHDQSLQLLNVNNGEIITLPQSEYHHQIIAKFTPDGLNVAATDCDTTCRIWNIRDQTHITIPVEKAMAVEITELIGHSPDGWLLLAGYLRHDKLRNSLHIWRFRVDNPPFTLNSDGWVLDHQRQGWVLDYRRERLIWVPKEIRQLFPMCNEVVLSDQVLQSVDYDGMLVGDEWSQCYLNDPSITRGSPTTSADVIAASDLNHNHRSATVHQRPMQTVHYASTKLDIALDEYANACAAFTSFGPISTLNYSQGLRDGMDAEIEVLTTFEKRMAQIKSTLNRARNSLSVAANSLPDEILSRIFHFTINLQSSSFDELVDGGKLPINSWAISQVCTRWRRVAFGSKGLWTHIDLAARDELVLLAQLFAARSGDLPLSVRAIERIDSSNIWSNNLLDTLFKAVGHRLETIDLTFGQSLFLPNASFPALRSLVHCAPGKLTQLVLSDRKIFLGGLIPDKYFETSAHWFIVHKDFRLQRMTGRKDYMSQCSYPVQLDISEQSFEEILYHVKILKLDQMYPLWTSKAYHGLSELRLTGPYRLTAAIGEQQFANILTASPKLRVLHFGLEVSVEKTHPVPVHLEELEVFLLQSLSHDTQQSILRLILPGTKRLEMSTTCNEEKLVELPAPVEEEYCRFFKRSNIVQFHVHSDLLPVHLPQLLALLPNLEVLVFRQVILQQLDLPERFSMPLCPNLHSVYCIASEVVVDVIQWIVRTHNLEKVVIWDSWIPLANGSNHCCVEDCEHLFADMSPPVQILDDADRPEIFEIEGWGGNITDRLAMAARADYVVH